MKEKLKIVSIVIIITIAFFSIHYFFTDFLPSFFKKERPDELCKKIQVISDNQVLIGLSKEEVKELLGKPEEEFDDENGNIYIYYAGKMDTGLFWNDRTIFLDYDYGCEFRIFFDKNYKVKSTLIKLIP